MGEPRGEWGGLEDKGRVTWGQFNGVNCNKIVINGQWSLDSTSWVPNIYTQSSSALYNLYYWDSIQPFVKNVAYMDGILNTTNLFN